MSVIGYNKDLPAFSTHNALKSHPDIAGGKEKVLSAEDLALIKDVLESVRTDRNAGDVIDYNNDPFVRENIETVHDLLSIPLPESLRWEGKAIDTLEATLAHALGEPPSYSKLEHTDSGKNRRSPLRRFINHDMRSTSISDTLKKKEKTLSAKDLEPITDVDKIGATPPQDVPFVPSKPSLPSPQAVEFIFLKTVNRMYIAGTAIMELNMQALGELEEKLKVLNAENLAKMEEALKLSQESGVWAFLKKIGSYILSALSIIFGASLSSTGAGGVIGSVMIAVGILGIVNLALEDTGCWAWLTKYLAGDNEERAKFLATFLPTVLSLTCASVGLIGTAGAIAWSSLNIMSKIVSAAQVAATSAEGVTTLGKGVCDYRNSLTEADLEEIREQIFINEHRFEKVVQRLEKQMTELSKSFTFASEIIKLSIMSNKRAITTHI